MCRAFKVIELVGFNCPQEYTDNNNHDNQGDGQQQVDNVHNFFQPVSNL